MKKAVLFDVDGTLLDTWDFVYLAVKHTLKTEGKSVTEENIKNAMGRTLAEYYKTLLPDIDPKNLVKLHREFQEVNYSLIKSFPKVRKTLKNLKKSGYLLVAISNRARESVRRSLKLSKIYSLFNLILTPEDVKHAKPHKEHIHKALTNLVVRPQDAYMVGDTDQDILAGRAAGVKTVGVTYGFWGKDIAKHKPDYLIDKIEDLLKILKK